VSAVLSAVSAVGLLREGMARLEAAGVGTPRREAEWLLGGVLGLSRAELFAGPRREPDLAAAARFREAVERRRAGEPIQYILGVEEFCGLRLRVMPAVLIPRQETEGLVDWAVDLVRAAPHALVADVGTGSGAIACAMAAAGPGLRLVGLDRSAGALAVAAGNVRSLGLGSRVRLVCGDLLAPLAGGRDLHAIVSNPPYLPSAVIPRLPREVAAFEPRQALDGGPDGMAAIRGIVAEAPRVLRPGGWLVMEIGEDQAGPVASLMAAAGFRDLEARRDLRGVERYIAGRLGGPGARRRPVSV
jgi:release factor glutamine methyltransferase